ncbi:hypothetical protein GGR58DRAFT_523513 [Xylaria digitata]|nr:hypothetical protein GGR58DRAFT_523513 [Xylaria digitata]
MSSMKISGGQLRQAWSVAITVMRRLSRLESSPKLIDALCFLCASWAVVETAQQNRDAYMSAFSQDLLKWNDIFPEVKDVSRFMWGINLNSVSQLQPQFTTAIEQLRLSVAELLVNTSEMFGRKYYGPHEKTYELGFSSQQWPSNTERAPPVTVPPDPPATARQKKTKDRILHKENTPPPLTDVVTLVASIIPAPAAHFVLGLHTLTLPTESSTCLYLNDYDTGTSQSMSELHIPS